MMSFGVQLSKTPKSAKYAIGACILVTVVLLLMNTSALDYISADEHVRGSSKTESIQTLDSGDTPTTDSEKRILPEEDERVVKKQVAKDQSHFNILPVFNKFVLSLNLKPFLIEPYILYSMLETKYKELLAKRHFNISNFMGSENIVTFGIFENDVNVLQKDENIHTFRKNGFQPYFVEVPLASWMQDNNKTLFSPGKYTSHIFYLYYEWTVHVVVFYNRNTYLWHAALDTEDRLKVLLEKELLFVNYDSAYENLSCIPLATKWANLTSIYVPSHPQHFLFQIPSSRFLECNLSRAANVRAPTDSPTSASSLENFKNRTLIALQELKAFFNPLLMHFWIFSGTMLGWYRQCDIIPYTSDVDFGAWASEIEDLDSIINYFRKNKNLSILERMGVLDEALEFQLRCKGLRVDVFFMYKIHNGSWASGHRPSKGYYFRYHYPHFTLCSADLLHQKVQVPCETEDVIVTEYGSNWMNPVSSWNYESSIKNRGPNIYWDEERRPKSFQEY